MTWSWRSCCSDHPGRRAGAGHGPCDAAARPAVERAADGAGGGRRSGTARRAGDAGARGPATVAGRRPRHPGAAGRTGTAAGPLARRGCGRPCPAGAGDDRCRPGERRRRGACRYGDGGGRSRDPRRPARSVDVPGQRADDDDDAPRRRAGRADAVATGAVVLLAARAGLETHRETISVMHMLGSTDVQVARLFQRRIALDAAIGGRSAASRRWGWCCSWAPASGRWGPNCWAG